ncbi:hypothetical protein BTI247_58880 (plasmid) [Bacillus thuringiensis Bt18247]|uniref:Uncharacterized protein n=1 Tax=Bacillus thuringiensis Bt18247 TaxID=1423143 RepID=A0A9W3SYT4_BACTU|nr:hypothetical protein BTI247_58880 [Bacillus thuringiensis Bt18247]
MNKWINSMLYVGILTTSIANFNISNTTYAQSIYDLQSNMLDCLNSIGRNQTNTVNFSENVLAENFATEPYATLYMITSYHLYC